MRQYNAFPRKRTFAPYSGKLHSGALYETKKNSREKRAMLISRNLAQFEADQSDRIRKPIDT